MEEEEAKSGSALRLQPPGPAKPSYSGYTREFWPFRVIYWDEKSICVTAFNTTEAISHLRPHPRPRPRLPPGHRPLYRRSPGTW